MEGVWTLTRRLKTGHFSVVNLQPWTWPGPRFPSLVNQSFLQDIDGALSRCNSSEMPRAGNIALQQSPEDEKHGEKPVYQL